MAQAAGPENIALPECLVCNNKPPARTVRITFACGHTYHWACHDARFGAVTKSKDKECARCRGMQAAGPDGKDGKGQTTPVKEDASAKLPSLGASGSAEAAPSSSEGEAGPSRQTPSSSGRGKSGGSPKGKKAAGGSKEPEEAAADEPAQDNSKGKRKADNKDDPKGKKRACKQAAH